MSEEKKNEFAKLLKYYLSLNGKQQIDIVNDLKYDKSTVSGWCNGSRVPKVDVIIQLAEYLHVEPGDLIIQGEEKPYYLDDDARDMAQFLFENPEYKILFDASRKVKREDIELVKALMDKFKDTEN